VKVNTTDAPVNPKGDPIRGNAEIHINGKNEITSANITLYEQNTTEASEQRGVTSEQSMAATFGHEIEHTTQENMDTHLANPNEKQGSPTVETRPNQITKNISTEYRMQSVPSVSSIGGKIGSSFMNDASGIADFEDSEKERLKLEDLKR
jgi:hypothetical protein